MKFWDSKCEFIIIRMNSPPPTQYTGHTWTKCRIWELNSDAVLNIAYSFDIFQTQFTRVLHVIFANGRELQCSLAFCLTQIGYVKPLLTLSYLYVTHQTRCLPFARVKGIKKGSVEYFFELAIFHYF